MDVVLYMKSVKVCIFDILYVAFLGVIYYNIVICKNKYCWCIYSCWWWIMFK